MSTQAQQDRRKAEPPATKELVNSVRKGTDMTYDQTSHMLHDYRVATQDYNRRRAHPDYPTPGHGENYTRRERLLARAEYRRGFRDGMEAVIAAMHGYEVRDRVREAYGEIKEGMKDSGEQ